MTDTPPTDNDEERAEPGTGTDAPGHAAPTGRAGRPDERAEAPANPADAPLHDEQGVTTADERRIATEELKELAGHWQERESDFDTRSAGDIAIEQRSLWGDALRRFRRNRLAMGALALMLLYVLLAIFVPIFDHPTDWREQDFSRANLGPSLEHPVGTDQFGRDLWVRAWRGGRISLSIAFGVALAILIIGTLYGSIAGYVGGRLDNAMMRFLDALYGLPYVPFAMIFVLLMRQELDDPHPLVYMVPALTVTTWFTAARIVRSQVLSLKQNDYVEAAQSQGAKWPRVVGRHVLPNAFGIFVVAVFLEVPNAILGEATLSFLGIGVQVPDPSWGKMAEEGYEYFDSLPKLIFVPGFLIASTVLAAIAIADGLRDALDPRGKAN